MSSAHEITRQRQQIPVSVVQQNAPEVPRRPRVTLGTNSNSNNTSTSTSSTVNNHNHNHGHPPGSQVPIPAIREIHKNAWLKRIAQNDKKGTPFVKKYEKLWVAFCVHDDAEAYLEFYSEPKMGATHRPNSYVSLNSCLHVSPSIIGQENNEYQFAVTLPTQVIRLVAANWDQMNEWVESLQGKLREMNVLSPKDNLYSKLPETRNFICSSGFVSTRDPNSPLPPTPNGIQTQHVHGTETSLYMPVSNATINLEPEPNFAVSSIVSTSSSSSRPSSNVSVNSLSEQYVTAGTTSIYVQSSRDGSGSDSGNCSGGSIMSVTSNSNDQSRVTVFPISVTSNSNLTTSIDLLEPNRELERPNTPSPSVSVVTGNHNNTVVQFGFDETERFNESAASSSSVIENNRTDLPTTPSVVYSVSKKSRRLHSFSGADRNHPSLPTLSSLTSTVKVNNNSHSHPEVLLERQNSAPSRPNSASSSSNNVYEHLYIPEIHANNSSSLSSSGHQHQRNLIPTNNGNISSEEMNSETAPPVIPRRDLHKKLSSNSQQRSSSLNRLEEQNGGTRNCHQTQRNQNSSRVNQQDTSPSSPRLQNNQQRINHKEISQQQQRSQINGIVNTNTNNTSPFIHTHGLEGDPLEALIGVRSGEYRIRREDAAPSNESVNSTQNSRNAVSQGGNIMSHVPLKEQQVLRLRAEINHPGGVRVVLRKKDCVNSIAFVDYLGAVWVAGWKQQQHPVLYYAFHVGDQILKVAGVTVQSSVEANRAIKMASNLQIEFIIRRVPHGNVCVLKRSREGEPLGLVVINNTAEIGEVLMDGLAASQGLPPTCRGTDGQLNCTWFLTEVNNRPLSLIARENEVRERLNAVGKEISILVQPSDLVKHLRKQLKSMKSFKDYLVV